MENNEIWKPVVGYEGLYEVSNMGRVRSLDMVENIGHGTRLRKGKVLKCLKCSNGYLQVHLYKYKQVKKHRIHRLVASAFIPNPSNLPCVNHINENKEDNMVENLEWVTYKENLEYSGNIEKALKVSHEKNKKPVLQLTQNGEVLAFYDSINDAYMKTGIDPSSISKVCRGKNKSAHGFVWSYK